MVAEMDALSDSACARGPQRAEGEIGKTGVDSGGAGGGGLASLAIPCLSVSPCAR